MILLTKMSGKFAFSRRYFLCLTFLSRPQCLLLESGDILSVGPNSRFHQLEVACFFFSFSSYKLVIFSHFSRYTSKNGTVYAIALEWPFTGELTLGAPISTENTQVSMLGYQGKFVWKPAGDKGGMMVTVPCIPANKLKSKWAWVFKLEYVH